MLEARYQSIDQLPLPSRHETAAGSCTCPQCVRVRVRAYMSACLHASVRARIRACVHPYAPIVANRSLFRSVKNSTGFRTATISEPTCMPIRACMQHTCGDRFETTKPCDQVRRVRATAARRCARIGSTACNTCEQCRGGHLAERLRKHGQRSGGRVPLPLQECSRADVRLPRGEITGLEPT